LAEHVVTASGGEYNAANLPPGSYMVDVLTASFASFKVDTSLLRPTPPFAPMPPCALES
jgi:hypothetical protein